MYCYFKKNVTFNDPFVLNSLNVVNRYIFKCERAAKVENGGEYLVILDELGPFWCLLPVKLKKISQFQLVTSKFSAFSGATTNGHYISQL